jgi:adenylate cyclase
MRLLPNIAFGTERYLPKVARRLHVVNIAAWIGALLAGIFAILFALYARPGTWQLVAVSGAATVLLALAPLLHRFGPLVAGNFVFAVGYAALGGLCYLLGTASGIHLQYLVVPALGLLFFGSERAMLAACWAVLGVSAYAVLQWYVPRSTGLIPRAEMFSATFVPAAMASAALLFSTVLYLMRQMAEAEATAEREQARSEALLAQILPEGVAQRLKENDSIADRYDEASILFSDMAGFTARASDISPVELVRYLDGVYRRFDAIVAKHGLEKIKTTGDAYMVVSGLPKRREDHAVAIAALALELRTAARTTLDVQGNPVNLRIGIASGSVVAGVIGRDKVFYDVWGDTVNLASRMETTSEPGRIQVAAGTYQRIWHLYEFSDGGIVDVRGKGQMQTWYIESERKAMDTREQRRSTTHPGVVLGSRPETRTPIQRVPEPPQRAPELPPAAPEPPPRAPEPAQQAAEPPPRPAEPTQIVIRR